MLTPELEKLILCGKAFFKTAVVGGAKTTINIANDRFAIITDITYLPYINPYADPNKLDDTNMQISIYGERGFNHYMFANSRSQNLPDPIGITIGRFLMPLAVQKIDCYLLHTTQIGISFISNRDKKPVIGSDVASYDNPGYQPPLDYGKEGLNGIGIPTFIDPLASGFGNYIVNRGGSGLPDGSDATQQIQFPAIDLTVPIIDDNPQFPIANINYVEILGQPGNIGI